MTWLKKLNQLQREMNLSKFENIIESIQQHNVGIKAKPVQGQNLIKHNKEQLLEERRMWKARFEASEEKK